MGSLLPIFCVLPIPISKYFRQSIKNINIFIIFVPELWK